jgi:hypothetical protein
MEHEMAFIDNDKQIFAHCNNWWLMFSDSVLRVFTEARDFHYTVIKVATPQGGAVKSHGTLIKGSFKRQTSWYDSTVKSERYLN